AGKGIRGIIAKNKKAALKLLEKETCGIVFICDKLCPCRDRKPVQQAGFELINEIKSDYPDSLSCEYFEHKSLQFGVVIDNKYTR
ncbi:unnamed protein product, partial [marine sediment metagenome]